MRQQRSPALRYGLACATAALALTPGTIFAQDTNASAGKVSPQTTLAVKLISQNHAQTGTATFTQQKKGVHVAVMLDQAPSGNEMAVVRKGSCPITAGTGSSGSGGSSGAMGSGNGSTMSSGNGMSSASGSNGVNDAGATGTNAAQTGASGTTTQSGMAGGSMSASGGGSATSYQIGQIKPTQGTTGQAAGTAETTLPNVQLTQLVQQGYTVDITAGSGSTQPMLCSDLQHALPPTTPAGSQ